MGNDADPAGRNASFAWNYRGPGINTNLNAPTSSLVPTDQALKMIFDWFLANGGNEMLHTFTFQDYKEDGGVKHFTKLKIVRDGKTLIESTLSDAKEAEKLDAKLFEKP